jgi:hypothetical protein
VHVYFYFVLEESTSLTAVSVSNRISSYILALQHHLFMAHGKQANERGYDEHNEEKENFSHRAFLRLARKKAFRLERTVEGQRGKYLRNQNFLTSQRFLSSLTSLSCPFSLLTFMHSIYRDKG